ncbi:hypothetical protein D1Z97_03975 [Riemerella anatipestifer]|nr:hypothetical protein [Riemerella anatipestifer]MRN00359.1 hypothetical protein [Riemerella anatipestifer]MRN02631.1 hypothetical protein [Riemerella anatipestifer]
MKSIKLFFASRYNVISITIVSILQYLLYYFFLDISSSNHKNNIFFQSNIVSILSFSFYMLVFYKLFSDGYYRLIAINFSKNKSIGIVYTDILRILLIGVFSWMLVYCISILIYYGKSNFDFEYIKKYFIYFVLFQLFLSLFACYLMSIKPSVWTVFISIGYLFFEDTIVMMNKDTIGNYLPKEIFVRLFTENSILTISVSLVYISILLLLIYKENYKTI